jgi:hypothetical protein
MKLSDIIVQAICSIIVIITGHMIYDFIKNSFTKKVVKDMYYTQVEKYKDIVNELQENHHMEDDLTHFLEESIGSTI